MRTLNIMINQTVTNGTINYTNVIGESFSHYQSNVRNDRKDSRGKDLPDFSKLERKVKRQMEPGYCEFNTSLMYLWNELEGTIEITAQEKNNSLMFNLTIHDDKRVNTSKLIDATYELINEKKESEYSEHFEIDDSDGRAVGHISGNPQKLLEWLEEKGYFSDWLKILI